MEIERLLGEGLEDEVKGLRIDPLGVGRILSVEFDPYGRGSSPIEIKFTWEKTVKKILFHRAQRRHDMPGKQLDRVQGFGEGQITNSCRHLHAQDLRVEAFSSVDIIHGNADVIYAGGLNHGEPLSC